MIAGYNPVVQALLASLFTWGVTAFGAALVFVLRANSTRVLDGSLGFASGVMLAATFWSLLAPAIEISENTFGAYAFAPVAVGFALGAAFVQLSDKLIPSCVVAEMSILGVLTKDHEKEDVNVRADDGARLPMVDTDIDLESKERYDTSTQQAGERISGAAQNRELLRQRKPDRSRVAAAAATTTTTTSGTTSSVPDEASQRALSWRRILLLIMAVTCHNVPEGLAVGVGFGSIGKTPTATFEKAFNLALGIGLQVHYRRIFAGLAVSLPLAGFGYSKWTAFLYGQASGMVEPLAALLGASAVVLMEPILPYALAFAGGAMFFVCIDDLIVEGHRNGNGKLASFCATGGFILMMTLDVSLG